MMEESHPPRRFAPRARPRLVLGSLAAAAGMSLGGCDSTPDFQPAEFTTVKECISAGFPDAVCQSGYNAASLEQQRSAPKFNSLKSCEDEWGGNHCVPATASGPAAGSATTGSSGSSIFVPMLAGFVVSQALQQRYYDRGDIGYGYYGGGGGYRGSPIYRSRTGGTVTVDRSGGRSVMKPVNVNTRSVAHSGFGGMSMSRSSSGGGSFGG